MSLLNTTQYHTLHFWLFKDWWKNHFGVSFSFLCQPLFLNCKRRAYLLSTFAHRPFQELILVFPAGGEGPHQGGPEEEGLRPKEELLGAQP